MTPRLDSLLQPLLWAFFAMIIHFGCSSSGQDSGNAADQVRSFADRIEVAEDPSGAMSVDQISSAHWGSDFQRARGNINRGLTRSAFWIRFRVDSAELGSRDTHRVVSLGTTLVEVDAYATADAVPPFSWQHLGPIDSPVAGIAALAYDLRDAIDPDGALDLAASHGAAAWLLFRVRSDRAFLFAPRIMSLRAHEHERNTASLRTGTYYGVMLVAIVYNVFLALWMRDRAYVLYILFEAAFTATVAEWDRTLTALWPTVLPSLSEGLNERLMSLTGALAVLFAREFLDLRASRRITFVSFGLVAVGITAIFFPLEWGRSYLTTFGNLFVLFAAAHVSFMAFYSWRLGNANAPWFALAWTTLLSTITGSALMNLGAIVPRFGYIDVIRLGSATEAMMLAAALARRMSSMKQAEANTRAALAEARIGLSHVLERQLASLNTLVSGVALEIGNPLNFAAGGAKDVVDRLGQAEILAEALTKDASPTRATSLHNVIEVARRSAALTTRGTERIDGIVKSLRAYVGTGAQPNEMTNLAECIRSTVARLATRLEESRIEVRLDLHSESTIHGRPGEMNQVFTNLILNACQAMPDGGKLAIVTEEEDEALWVVITDTGPGVPADLRQAIFDPFFTTRAPNEGTGLGLAVALEIVRRHGGTLDLLSPRGPESGAEFAIRFPRS